MSSKLATPRLGTVVFFLVLSGLGLGGCAQRPQEVATTSHGKEYFPASVYGHASRRVVADGQPIPRGGGQYLVGKPYTVAGHTYYPSESHRTQVGNASWYGDAFHGRLTANGEIYDRGAFTAASPTMPLPCYARVTNLRNNYSMIVRVNDRGPYASDRIMDVSRRVAESLDFKRYGTTKLKVEYVARASLAGSDDDKLLATLKTNGPASWEGAPTMVAETAPPARVASIAPFVPQPVRRVESEYARRPARFVEDDMPRRRPQPPETTDDRRRRAFVVGSAPERAPHESHFSRAGRDANSRRFADGPRREWTDPMPTGRIQHSAHGQAFQPEPPPRRARVAQEAGHRSMLPPSRPMDLGTIPGASTQIRARRDAKLRMARARDD